jgi:MFS family permease
MLPTTRVSLSSNTYFLLLHALLLFTATGNYGLVTGDPAGARTTAEANNPPDDVCVQATMPLVFSPWASLSAGVLLMLSAGTMYGFASWANNVFSIGLGLSQTEVNAIGAAANAGAWSSVLTGFFFDRFGPRWGGVLAGTLILIGYGSAWLAGSGALSDSAAESDFSAFARSNVWFLVLCALLWGMGSGLSYTVALATNLMNFDAKDRGRIVGLLVCFFGLSSGVFVQLLRGFFGAGTVRGATNFVLFLAIVCSTVPFISSAVGFVNVVADPPVNYVENLSRTRWALGLGVVLAIYVAAAALVETLVDFDSDEDPTLLLTVVMCVLVSLFLLLPCGRSGRPLFYFTTGRGGGPQSQSSGGKNVQQRVGVSSEEEEGSLSAGAEIEEGEDATESSPAESVGVDMTLWQAVKTVDFWLLFAVFCCVIGPGIVMVNNLSVMNMALSQELEPGKSYAKSDLPTTKQSQTLVTLFAVFNTAGRMIVGVGSDITNRRRSESSGQQYAMAMKSQSVLVRLAHVFATLSRESWLTLVCVGMCVTNVFLALARDSSWLWFAVITLGLSYGGILDLFGLSALFKTGR